MASRIEYKDSPDCLTGTLTDKKGETLRKLTTFLESSPYKQRLRHEELQFLRAYCDILKSGQEVTEEQLTHAAHADDFKYMTHGNAGRVEEAVYATGADEISIPFWATQRENIFIQHEDGSFLFIRNLTPSITDPSGLHLAFFNLDTGRFEDLPGAMIGGIPTRLGLHGTKDQDEDPLFNGKIKRSDILLMFNKPAASEDRLEVFVDRESEGPLPVGELFYHQDQTGYLCQLHAANAFVGKYGVTPSGLQSYLEATVPRDDEEGTAGLAAGSVAGGVKVDVRTGTDPSAVSNYLKVLRAEGKITTDLEGLQTGRIKKIGEQIIFSHGEGEEVELTEEFFSGKTRVMFGLCDRAHASALRKDQDGGWVHIDSEHRAQRRYATLTDFLKMQFTQAVSSMGGKPINFAFTIA
ncbi:MAG: hypothetical protein S4CHLAM37_02420 [Chlamydiia bacterium]|nr:hypothetical protein [Chlamydiia bacterium]